MNTALSTTTDQFQAFQALLRQGQASNASEAAQAAEALLSGPLSSIQRALVLQLQGELEQLRGHNAAAERCWRASLELRFSPELALRLQEQAALVELQARGHGGALTRTLAARFQGLPLDQQRRALLAEMEQQPSLRPLAKQLQRLMPPG